MNRNSRDRRAARRAKLEQRRLLALDTGKKNAPTPERWGRDSKEAVNRHERPGKGFHGSPDR